ncbi:hypothetical protein PPERSA_05806 [Pseudocohnilembus persalinus]|uniref:Uncharacterized protein n=1 Tax=Pseudocohnilembus persalinus TaxID=266149 RepID=A0A0V0QZK4_PSEPJ|nr:hypothetical protein PPERSA_05806 [Pseudocohnilembus persalinus]|eukprot:KRX07743.1 hypothetical protein PPERSA_05806 [Pseudocohnilembus persalinus]
MAEIMNIMDEKQFVYIENFTSVQLSLQKCEEFLQNEQNKKKKTDILSFFENKALKKQTLTDPKGWDSKFFRQSKKILLMFRRQSDKSVQLELRHQRTSDVVFDLVDENQANKLDDQSQQYVYNMIETLLPKARIGIENDQFKMMEIYGNSQKPRDHWICFNQKE